MIDWKDKKVIFEYIHAANVANEEYFLLKRKTLVNIGYDEVDVKALLACERRALLAMKKVFYPFAMEFLGALTSDEAEAQARPYLIEYETSMELMNEISAPKQNIA
jgi:hypothetical protein